MPSPFPGMDPYLENPEVWPDVHHELVSTIRELLNRVIRPKYVARVEERLYMVPDGDEEAARIQRIPDVEIDLPAASAGRSPSGSSLAIAEPVIVHADPVREARVEIADARTREVVTVIELLSPSNKAHGTAGRESFVAKRNEVMNSAANWVEIDLLRTPPRRGTFRHPYLVTSSPVNLRPGTKNRPIHLHHPLPVVGIPLRHPDDDAPLDLQAALALAYDRAAYDATVNYAAPPDPPLAGELAKWAKKIVKPKKTR